MRSLSGKVMILAAALVAGGSAPTAARAQEDDSLKRLLEEIKPADPGGAESDAPDDPEDKGLDAMLEKLGIREDRPGTLGGAGQGEPKPPGGLTPDDQDLDAHLRRLLGRLDPEKDDEQQGEEGGPMSDTMKKMRDVEQRLGKLDTGEQTREEQQKIVEGLDQVLERIGKMRREMRQGQQEGTRMAGQGGEPGDSEGDPNSPDGGGSAPVKPDLPPPPQGMAAAKDAWGHLQGAMREVMDNVSRMMPLEGKQDLIERYFLSVAKESLERGGADR